MKIIEDQKLIQLQSNLSAAFYLTKDVENFFDKQMAQRFAAVYGETEYKKFW